MRLLVALAVLCVWAVMMSAVPMPRVDAQTVPDATGNNVKPAPEKDLQQPKETGGRASNAGKLPPETAKSPWVIVSEHPWWTVLPAIALVIGVGVLLWSASRNPEKPFILQLGPSFFFWLGMGYASLLLLMAAAYNIWFPSPDGSKPVLLGGMLPIAVPWFGAWARSRSVWRACFCGTVSGTINIITGTSGGRCLVRCWELWRFSSLS